MRSEYRATGAYSQPGEGHERERRLCLLIRRLPAWLQPKIHWLRRPEARAVRIPAGILLMLGGLVSILPVFGLWMLPVGLILLAEDVPALRRMTGRGLEWIELHRPHWMGLPRRYASKGTAG